MRVPTFGDLRIEAYLQLPAAFRSLSRPSSAPDAKAFTLCSFSLELPAFLQCSVLFSELLEFRQILLGFLAVQRFSLCTIHLSVKLFLPFFLERPILIS